MKYIIRLLAAIPVMCMGISAVFAFAASFDYIACILLAIGDFLAMYIYLSNFELIVKDICDLFRVIADKTPIYG